MNRPDQRDVTGILLLDKPPGLSSNQALQKVKRLFGARKAGHTGSLDPMATGLLPVCFGEATKIAGYLLGARKGYDAEIRLGVATTTDDAEGEPVSTRPVPEFGDAEIAAALDTLRGRITQVPPAYSAIKQGGVALYKRARRGEAVSVPPREVEVHRLELVSRDAERLRVRIDCGSGTYVRSLARDLGERLGCGAHVAALRRTWVDPFRDPVMWSLAPIETLRDADGSAALDRLLLPLESGLAGLPALPVSVDEAVRLGQGKRLDRPGMAVTALGWAVDPEGHAIALVEVRQGGEVRVVRGFDTAAPSALAGR
jgi:tRNA pseudouridine55 synthase